jgi:hypothetical protein
MAHLKPIWWLYIGVAILVNFFLVAVFMVADRRTTSSPQQNTQNVPAVSPATEPNIASPPATVHPASSPSTQAALAPDLSVTIAGTPSFGSRWFLDGEIGKMQLRAIDCAAFVEFTNLRPITITVKDFAVSARTDDDIFGIRPMRNPYKNGRLFTGNDLKNAREITGGRNFEEILGETIFQGQTWGGWMLFVSWPQEGELWFEIRDSMGRVSTAPFKAKMEEAFQAGRGITSPPDSVEKISEKTEDISGFRIVNTHSIEGGPMLANFVSRFGSTVYGPDSPLMKKFGGKYGLSQLYVDDPSPRTISPSGKEALRIAASGFPNQVVEIFLLILRDTNSEPQIFSHEIAGPLEWGGWSVTIWIGPLPNEALEKIRSGVWVGISEKGIVKSLADTDGKNNSAATAVAVALKNAGVEMMDFFLASKEIPPQPPPRWRSSDSDRAEVRRMMRFGNVVRIANDVTHSLATPFCADSRVFVQDLASCAKPRFSKTR